MCLAARRLRGIPAFARHSKRWLNDDSPTHVSAERVVADALKAAEHGHASVVPGGPQVRWALGSTRFVPSPLVLPILKRVLKR